MVVDPWTPAWVGMWLLMVAAMMWPLATPMLDAVRRSAYPRWRTGLVLACLATTTALWLGFGLLAGTLARLLAVPEAALSWQVGWLLVAIVLTRSARRARVLWLCLTLPAARPRWPSWPGVRGPGRTRLVASLRRAVRPGDDGDGAWGTAWRDGGLRLAGRLVGGRAPAPPPRPGATDAALGRPRLAGRAPMSESRRRGRAADPGRQRGIGERGGAGDQAADSCGPTATTGSWTAPPAAGWPSSTSTPGPVRPSRRRPASRRTSAARPPAAGSGSTGTRRHRRRSRSTRSARCSRRSGCSRGRTPSAARSPGPSRASSCWWCRGPGSGPTRSTTGPPGACSSTGSTGQDGHTVYTALSRDIVVPRVRARPARRGRAVALRQRHAAGHRHPRGRRRPGRGADGARQRPAAYGGAGPLRRHPRRHQRVQRHRRGVRPGQGRRPTACSGGAARAGQHLDAQGPRGSPTARAEHRAVRHLLRLAERDLRLPPGGRAGRGPAGRVAAEPGGGAPTRRSAPRTWSAGGCCCAASTTCRPASSPSPTSAGRRSRPSGPPPRGRRHPRPPC